MNNKLILSCLLICPLSFASKPAPAAGSGAGRGLPPVALAQATAPRQAAQIDVKQLEEQRRKDSARIAQLTAELEALKLQMNKDKEEPKQKWLGKWNCKPSGKDEWTDEVMITLEGSDKFLRLTSKYFLQEGGILGNNVFYNQSYKAQPEKIDFAKSVTEAEKLFLMVLAVNFKMVCIFNGLQTARGFDGLKGILNGNGSGAGFMSL